MRFIAFILILLCLNVESQGFRSRIYLPGSLAQTTKAVYPIPGNKYFGAGFTTEIFQGKQVTRLAVMGLDSVGKLGWVKKYGDTTRFYFYNLFAARSFFRLGDFIYYAGCVTGKRPTGVFTKFNLTGDTIWQKIYGDIDSLEDVVPQMACPSVDGGFLITGFFQSWGSNGQRTLLIKTNSEGVELWRKKIGIPGPNVQDGKAIVQDSATKKIILTGIQYGSNGAIDNHLILDSLGNEVYHGAFIRGHGIDLIQAKNKAIFVAGYNDLSDKNNDYQSAALIKFDLNSPYYPGTWQRISSKEKYPRGNTSLLERNDGSILVAQWWDSLYVTHYLSTTFEKVHQDGRLLWSQHYYYDMFASACAIENTPDNGWVGAFEVKLESPLNPFFFVKYDSTGCDTTVAYCSLLAALNKNESGQLRIYPIPCNDRLYIKNTTGSIQANLFDGTGSHKASLKLDRSTEEAEINTAVLVPGVYLLRLSSGEAIFQRKIIVQH